MNPIKAVAQAVVGLFALLWMLPGALWANRRPGNKLGLPSDDEITLHRLRDHHGFDPCPHHDIGQCHYAAGKRCMRPEDEDCPK